MTWKCVKSVLFIVFCFYILWLTLLSREAGICRVEMRIMWAYRELFSGDPNWKRDLVQNIKNIVLFIPFGLLFPLRKWKIVLLSALLFSISIESIQYFMGLGLCELDDVICNTIGAMLGFGTWFLIQQMIISKKGMRDSDAT